MSLCEGTAGAGFQIALEPARDLFVGKLHRYNDDPWSTSSCVDVEPVVVPGESANNIRRNSDVVSIVFALASEDVHEPRVSMIHVVRVRTNRAEGSFVIQARIHRGKRGIADSAQGGITHVSKDDVVLSKLGDA